MLLKLERA